MTKCRLNSASDLSGLAFGLQFGIIGNFADLLLNLAYNLVQLAFYCMLRAMRSQMCLLVIQGMVGLLLSVAIGGLCGATGLIDITASLEIRIIGGLSGFLLPLA